MPKFQWKRMIRAMALLAALAMLIATTPLASAQTETVVYNFRGGTDGYYPYGVPVLHNGSLYGVTLAGGAYGAGTIYKVTTRGTETVLHTFTGGADGGFPYAALISDGAGNLYGTTDGGGTYNFGTVFKVTPSGTETILYNFTGTQGGYDSQGSLVRDAAGNLYGTTYYGGSSVGSNSCGSGCGVVFELTAAGIEKVLYDFTGGPDGGSPIDGLLKVGSNLYGIASAGGAHNHGAIFKVTLAGKETVLYSFTGGTDGGLPRGTLIRDSQGNLYGTTEGGGDLNCYGPYLAGCGTVFELTPAGVEKVLYAFTGGTDGTTPFTGVIRDSEGNLYGSTAYGGNSDCMYGCGTVFEIIAEGTEKQLYVLTGGASGVYAEGVVRDSKGNLYAASPFGGNATCNSLGCGLVFKIAP